MLLITLDYIAGSDNPSILLPPPSADDGGFGKVRMQGSLTFC